MMALTAETIGRSPALLDLAPEWWDLWRRIPSATPFQTPAWLLPWWRHFGPGELFAVTVRHGTRLVGLAPFYIEHGHRGRRILPIGISLSDYLDVLIDPELAAEVGRALVRQVMRERHRWDCWNLEELRPGAAALGLPRPDGCTEEVCPQSACPVLDLSDPAGIPARKLRKLRMAHNRAARRGAQVFAVGQGDSECFLNEVFRLHTARWTSRGEPGLLEDRRVRRFEEEAAPLLVEAGLVRLYGMRVGGRIVGAYFGFLDRQGAYAYLGGFDPEFSFESPGTILIGHAIQEAAREGAREFHFLRGREAYKYEWGAVDRWNSLRSLRRLAPDPTGSEPA